MCKRSLVKKIYLLQALFITARFIYYNQRTFTQLIMNPGFASNIFKNTDYHIYNAYISNWATDNASTLLSNRF